MNRLIISISIFIIGCSTYKGTRTFSELKDRISDGFYCGFGSELVSADYVLVEFKSNSAYLTGFLLVKNHLYTSYRDTLIGQYLSAEKKIPTFYLGKHSKIFENENNLHLSYDRGLYEFEIELENLLESKIPRERLKELKMLHMNPKNKFEYEVYPFNN